MFLFNLFIFLIEVFKQASAKIYPSELGLKSYEICFEPANKSIVLVL